MEKGLTAGSQALFAYQGVDGPAPYGAVIAL